MFGWNSAGRIRLVSSYAIRVAMLCVRLVAWVTDLLHFDNRYRLFAVP
jgi:hypothetical protein